MIENVTILETRELTKRFFAITAVDHVDLIVNDGEIVGLIGPNGSGKTTLFNCITGIMKPEGGQVCFKGQEITNMEPHNIVLQGMTRTFQTIRVFNDLTIIENILVAAQQHQEDNIFGRLFRTKEIREYESVAIGHAEEALEFVGLQHMRDQLAKTLSYGQRKLLAFATCFVSNPTIVLLDEPTAAVNPLMIKKMKNQIRHLNDRGTTFLIVEHNMEFIMDLADRIVVLDEGRKIADGLPSEIQKNERVLEAYFGS